MGQTALMFTEGRQKSAPVINNSNSSYSLDTSFSGIENIAVLYLQVKALPG